MTQGIFNSREIATGIWLGVLLLLMLSMTDMRRTVGGIVRDFFSHPILTCVSLMTFYVVALAVWPDALRASPASFSMVSTVLILGSSR